MELKSKADKKNVLKQLYNWVLGWAEKPSAQVALFCLAFAESSFFPIPPDVLLIPLVLGYRKKWWRLALLVTVGSALGGVFGYFIGWKLWWAGANQFSAIADLFFHIPGFTKELFYSMKEKYELYNFWIVFTAGFTPIPYKIITVSAGAFQINFITFLLASVVSRGARFFLVAFLIYYFGEPIRLFIDKYFNWLALAFTILLIGGFIVIKKVL
jgi:membrane protein YqaA with SNARE-associated domain